MILFVCRGNVARSQIAEALMIKKGFSDAQSAGTHVKAEKEGVQLKDDGEFAINAVENFRKITGVDLSHKTRKSLTIETAEKADRIIVLVDGKELPEYMSRFQEKTSYWVIEDPHEMNYDGYKDIVDQIEAKVNELIKIIRAV